MYRVCQVMSSGRNIKFGPRHMMSYGAALGALTYEYDKLMKLIFLIENEC